VQAALLTLEVERKIDRGGRGPAAGHFLNSIVANELLWPF